MTLSSYLVLENISKRVGALNILSDIHLTVGEGEFLCLLGPSGCGKTTLLKTIAGLDFQTEGSIYLAGENITHKKPQDRDCGVLFQSYALFPNLTVTENIAYGIHGNALGPYRTKKELQKHRVNEMLMLMELGDHAHKYPSQLSGGQQQRVAMARALAPSPSVLLLDEPMSALDAKVREHLQYELRALQQRLGITTIMVTHDQQEAMMMADRIAILNQGKIEQVGTAKELYCRPKNAFVAQFLGETNWIRYEKIDSYRAQVGEHTLQLTHPISNDRGRLCVRPESIQITKEISRSDNAMQGKVIDHHFLGHSVRLNILLKGTDNCRVTTHVSPQVGWDVMEQTGEKLCWVRIPEESITCYGDHA